MKKILTTGFLLLSLFNFAFAQKRTTVLGDAWTGEVVATDDTTREITIKFEDKGKTETFVGVLPEGYKVKMKDGSSHALRVSEIPNGTRVRIFSKTKERDVGGRKAKVNLISLISFLGKDDFGRLREQLNVEPSVSVTPAESTDLPVGNPLRLHLAIEDPELMRSFVAWLTEWNKERAQKYGALEVVPNLAQSDICLVVYRGSERMIVQFPIEVYDARGNVHSLSYATAHLLTRTDQGLKILWSQRLLVGSERPKGSKGRIEREFEKRMKERSQAAKK